MGKKTMTIIGVAFLPSGNRFIFFFMSCNFNFKIFSWKKRFFGFVVYHFDLTRKNVKIISSKKIVKTQWFRPLFGVYHCDFTRKIVDFFSRKFVKTWRVCLPLWFDEKRCRFFFSSKKFALFLVFTTLISREKL